MAGGGASPLEPRRWVPETGVVRDDAAVQRARREPDRHRAEGAGHARDRAGEPEGGIEAGEFGRWLDAVTAAIAAGGGSDVPCGTCTACCRSSQFVHIAPDETATLARIPRGLLVNAPGWPAGHVVMGYDERGHCPMLGPAGCTIYQDRPRTCRTYDCRIFAATGVVPLGGDGAGTVGERVRRWRFDHRGAGSDARHRAVRATAAVLQDHPELLGAAGEAPPTMLALAAIAAHRAALPGTAGTDATGTDATGTDATGTDPAGAAVVPSVEAVRVELGRRTERPPSR
jgi:hypothetical protein